MAVLVQHAVMNISRPLELIQVIRISLVQLEGLRGEVLSRLQRDIGTESAHQTRKHNYKGSQGKT